MNPDESGTPDIFAAIKAGEILVHHPYDSFRTSVQSFLTQAAADPQVLAIKHTVYRTSYSEDNPVTRALMRAAQMGKEVVALIELQARFDEESNIEWAKSLGEAGVHVVYGLPGLKTHGKLALVVRQEGEKIQRYCHVGTGNYNPQTARIYEDVGLLSASEDLCEDAARLFNHLTGYARPTHYERLLVAPGTLRSAIVELIREQAKLQGGQKGEVVMKMNSLSDPALIEELYEASRSGVKIDLIVRGICCLRPGVPGLSENIRVRSIVGRFLEHSRLFRFGPLDGDPAYYMSSADMMTRNLDRRVEVAARIDDARLKQRIEEILQVNLDPASEAWELDGSGSWRRTQTQASSASDSPAEGPSTNTHERFQELASLRANSEEPLEPRT
jgi:polyphosphate kinase